MAKGNLITSATTVFLTNFLCFSLQKGPLELTYRIYEYTAKKIKLDDSTRGDDDIQSETQTDSSDWKEVQLRISENGEMSVMGIQEAENEPVEPTKEPPALKLIGKSTTSNTATATTATSCSNTGTTCVNVLSDSPKVNTAVECSVTLAVTTAAPSTVTTTAPSTVTTTAPPTTTTTTTSVEEEKTVVCTTTTVTTTSVTVASTKTSESSDNKLIVVVTTAETKNNVVCTTKASEVKNKGVKHKIETTTDCEPPQKQTKPTVVNHSLGLQHLSNNHPLKKHSQMTRNVESSEPTKTFTKPVVTYVNKNLQQQQNRPGTPVSMQKYPPKQPPPCYMPKTTYTPIINVPKVQTSAAKPSSSAITTPTTAVSTKMTIKSKPSTPIGYKTLRDPPKSWNPQISRANLTKPPIDPKFTDLKNVRPAKFFKMRNNMPRYLGNPASGVKPMYQVHTSPEKDKSEIKKHSIVKIDPKTLKPISEKAPETTSLSNQSDLKINTSSVPIFNPLKLQSSSPKNDRKSPKSPTTKPTASPPNKREKLNLNFTPSNPFIPNLTSPTVSPNQFIYPSGPPGFPSYDPRFMAAYHSLLYGQRMPFTSNHLQSLSLDLNQRMAPSTSPKLQQQSSPKAPTNTKSPKPVVKKSGKEGQKAEKSLQNAVEKLTQKKVESMANNVGGGDAGRGNAVVSKSETVVKNNVQVTAVEKVKVAQGEEEQKKKKASEPLKADETKSDINEIKDKSEKTVDTGTKLEREKNLSNNNTDSLESLVQVDGKK